MNIDIILCGADGVDSENKITMTLDWMIDRRKGNVLFLGEGNFSFSAGLVRRCQDTCLLGDVWLTCFESDSSKTDLNVKNEEAVRIKADNMEYLRSRGCQILESVNAEHLEEDIRVSQLRFARIIFMFPHVGGKMKINRNRRLLHNVLMSCRSLLLDTGTIVITLCRGQGGTPAETATRHVADTWKLVDTCHEADTVLTRVEEFPCDQVMGYMSTGYRGLSKGFNVQGAMMHFIKKRQPRKFKVVTSLNDPAFQDHCTEDEEPSLYPPVHTHHLSYWLPDHVDGLDDADDQVDNVIKLSGAKDVVVSWRRFSQYQDEEGRKSETLEFQVCDKVRPLGHSRALHLLIQILGRSLENCYNVERR